MEFAHWIVINVPLMLVIMTLSVVLLQVWFLGLLRPMSKDAKTISTGVQGEELARAVIKQQLVDMGPMSFHEISVALMFILAILLWFLRKPQFVVGWTELLTDTKVSVLQIH